MSFLLSLISIVLFFGVGCGVLSARDEQAAELHLRIGTSQLEGGAYPQALASLLKAESMDSENPVIQNNLGLAYFVREKYDLAEKHIRKALKIAKNYSDARNNLGRTLIEKGEYSEAIKELKLVIDDLTYTHPEKPLINFGIAQFRLKKFTESLQSFVKAIEIQKDNCLAHSYYGRSLFELKRFKKSSDALDRAVNFCKSLQFDEPHYYSALAYYQLGDAPRAEARFEEILKIYPQGKYLEQSRSMLETIRK